MQNFSLLIDTSLQRAAEVLGDITAPAMARFYEVYPESREAFAHHAPCGRETLEAEMVQNALYWVMNWLERPTEIRIALGSSVPHHEETLKVVAPWYRGLLEAVVDVIAETVPGAQLDERELWKQIRRELGEAVALSRSTFPLRPGPAPSDIEPSDQ